MKFKTKLTNSVDAGKWVKYAKNQLTHDTTNSTITPEMFKRERKEYDNATLVVHRDLYLGERQ